MFGIIWAGLQFLYPVIILISFVIIHVLIRWYKSDKALKQLTSKRWRSLLVVHGSYMTKLVQSILFIVGFIALALVLLRPQWDKKNEKIEQQGRDLLIAVDISRSMLGQDLKPNRLDFAKAKIKKILANLSCERVGLILFSGDSVVQCPLTKDYAAFLMFLDQLDVETISSGTTSIQGAISTALTVFENDPEKKTKLLCVFTDGEDFSSNLKDIKIKAEKAHLAIFTFGVGTVYGAPIPILNYLGQQTGFEKDSAGKIIMSTLNEGILKNLSEQTGGQYIPITVASDDDVKEFISLVQKFEKDNMEDVEIQRYQEQYPYLIAISLICFLIEWVL